MVSRWEHFVHEADIGVRGLGSDLSRAFEQAAVALTAIVTDPRQVAAKTAVEIRCQAPDREVLLVDWLNALIFEMATRKMLFGRYEVRIEDDTLVGRAWGEPVEVTRHQPAVEPKGATYTELAVRELPTGWLAQCVIDV